MRYLIAPKIFDGYKTWEGHALLVSSELVLDMVPIDCLEPSIEKTVFQSETIAPGLIDWQVNGGGGVLFNNDRSANALQKIASGHYLGGTTAFYPTIVTDEFHVREEALAAVKFATNQSSLGVLGIHFEGPFFCSKRRGVHIESQLKRMHADDLRWHLENSDTKQIVTIAPERVTSEQITKLVEAGIFVSLGHTDCGFDLAEEAFDSGAHGVTHLFNAMSQASGREPGVVGAALLNDQTWCGIIADGIHVSPVMIELALRAKPKGKLTLVTDAMATVGSANKSFKLYGESIKEEDGQLVNSEGRLAGAAISMIDCVRFMHEKVGVSLEEALRMASLYPAQMLQIDHERGSLLPGSRADIVCFDSQFKVKQTWVGGHAKLTQEASRAEL